MILTCITDDSRLITILQKCTPIPRQRIELFCVNVAISTEHQRFPSQLQSRSIVINATNNPGSRKDLTEHDFVHCSCSTAGNQLFIIMHTAILIDAPFTSHCDVISSTAHIVIVTSQRRPVIEPQPCLRRVWPQHTA